MLISCALNLAWGGHSLKSSFRRSKSSFVHFVGNWVTHSLIIIFYDHLWSSVCSMFDIAVYDEHQIRLFVYGNPYFCGRTKYISPPQHLCQHKKQVSNNIRKHAVSAALRTLAIFEHFYAEICYVMPHMTCMTYHCLLPVCCPIPSP